MQRGHNGEVFGQVEEFLVPLPGSVTVLAVGSCRGAERKDKG